MRGVTYYQRMFLLPILMLLCSIPLGNRPSLFPDLAVWYWCAGLLGMPYLLTLAYFARTILKGDEEDLQDLSFRLPRYLGAIQCALGGAVGVCYGSAGACFLGMVCGFVVGIFGAVIGYFYFLGVDVLFRLLQRVGWIRESA